MRYSWNVNVNGNVNGTVNDIIIYKRHVHQETNGNHGDLAMFHTGKDEKVTNKMRCEDSDLTNTKKRDLAKEIMVISLPKKHGTFSAQYNHLLNDLQ